MARGSGRKMSLLAALGHKCFLLFIFFLPLLASRRYRVGHKHSHPVRDSTEVDTVMMHSFGISDLRGGLQRLSGTATQL